MNSNYPRRTFLKMAALLPATSLFSLNLESIVKTKQASVAESKKSATAFNQLNPDLTFENFVIGKLNEHAYRASLATAEGRWKSQLLYIHGPNGMGKTHLLHAIGNKMQELNPARQVQYLSAEHFVRDCIISIRRGAMQAFRDHYRNSCQVLLLDEVSYLARSEACQNELLSILDHYKETGRQIVVASERPMNNIVNLKNAIRSRIEGGHTESIKMPDIETRKAIVHYKAKKRGLNCNLESIEYIAKISNRSPRQIEGHLQKLAFQLKGHREEIDLSLTRNILG